MQFTIVVEMIQRVLRNENDFVFVGRRNTPGATALGSTVRKLIRKCPAPIWAVDPTAELVHESIMAATDLTSVGERAVELGAFVAQASGAALHVVHAWQMPFEAQFQSSEDHDDRLREIQQGCEEKIRAALPAGELEVTLHVGCNSPSRAIQAGVEALGAELLVMGTLSRGGIAGFLMGNTAERLLDRISCSLLTIKPEDFMSPVRVD